MYNFIIIYIIMKLKGLKLSELVKHLGMCEILCAEGRIVCSN